MQVVRARVGLESERFVNLDDLKRVLDSNDDVKDSKRALEELKAVLEKYKTVHTVPV